MGFDYGKYFGEIRLTHDLTTRADERAWRLTAPGRGPRASPSSSISGATCCARHT